MEEKPMTATEVLERNAAAPSTIVGQDSATSKWLEEVTRIVRNKLIEEGKLVPGEWDFKLELNSTKPNL